MNESKITVTKGARLTMLTLLALVATLVVGVFLASGVALAITEFGGSGNDALEGTNAADRLYGRAADYAIWGLAGHDDRLVGGSGEDSVSGGPGNDRILGPGVEDHGLPTYEKGSDTLSGEAGEDQLIGGLGPDRLSGGDGRDLLLDALGEYGKDRSADVLSGGAGDDELDAWSGAGPQDSLRCGGGSDRVVADKGIDRVAQDCEIVFWHPQG